MTTDPQLEEKIMKKECKDCYGKGYSTELCGETIGRADFIGDKDFTILPCRVAIKICSCSRGKDLKKYFDIKPNNLHPWQRLAKESK